MSGQQAGVSHPATSAEHRQQFSQAKSLIIGKSRTFAFLRLRDDSRDDSFNKG